MDVVTTIKSVKGFRTTWTVENSVGQLIATVTKTLKKDSDSKNGKYRMCMVGGPAHGKITYAQDWQHMNDKTVEIAALFNNQ